jgi:hypothetical protein
MDADGKVFHKTCMKCEHCACRLSLGNYAALNGKYYCKTHFKQLFKTKGNYTEGFGEEDAKKKWSPQVSHFNMSGVNFGSGSSTIKQRAVTVGPISQVGSHKYNETDTEGQTAPATDPDAQAPVPTEEANPQATPDAIPSSAAEEVSSDLGEAPASTEGGDAQQQQEEENDQGGSDVQSEAGSAGEAAEVNGADDTTTATPAAVESSAAPGEAPAAEAGDETAAAPGDAPAAEAGDATAADSTLCYLLLLLPRTIVAPTHRLLALPQALVTWRKGGLSVHEPQTRMWTRAYCPVWQR